MSPEQFRDTKHVGPATDRYALAVIAFELLTGELPYDGRSLPELPAPAHGGGNSVAADPGEGDAAQGDGAGRRGGGGGLPPCAAAERLHAARRWPSRRRRRYSSGNEMAHAFSQAAQQDGVWEEPTRVDPLFEPMPHPLVEITQQGQAPQQYDIREGPVVLGRHEACQCVIASPRMSRLHAGDLHPPRAAVDRGSPEPERHAVPGAAADPGGADPTAGGRR